MAGQHNPSPAEPEPRSWFVVANGSRARAYVQRIGHPGYDVVRAWDAPEARMTSAELGEDRPGRVFPSAHSDQRSGVETENREQSPKGHAMMAFEDTLLEELTQALRRREVLAFYLLAPAPMLHRLRERMPTDLREALAGDHAGDFTQRPTADVFKHLDSLRRGEDAGRA